MENKNTKINTPKSERRVETLIIVLFTVIALVMAVAVVAKNFSPADPDVDTDIPFHTGDVETQTDNEGNRIEPDDSQKDKYIRKEGVYNFLLVGYDKSAGLTDVNMLAQFDTNTGAINIIQLPRDTYARYNMDGYYRKINGAYNYFKRDFESFASFLEKNLCIKIDFYGSIDLVAFRNIVDIIGGVEMYVPKDMEYEDPAQDLYIDLKEGYQTLDGEKAEQFVRYRSGWATADIGRTDAQKLFMTAFLKKFIDSMSVSTLSQVGAQMLKYADTNLTLQEFIFFATKVLDIDLDKLTMMTLPGMSAREYGNSGTWYYVLSRSAMLDAVNKYLNVYTIDISDSIFDPNKMFTNPDVDYMLKIYNSDGNSEVYVGNEVDQEGIYIPSTRPSTSVDTQPPSTDTEAPDTEYADTDTPDTEVPDTETPDTETPDTDPIDTEETTAAEEDPLPSPENPE